MSKVNIVRYLLRFFEHVSCEVGAAVLISSREALGDDVTVLAFLASVFLVVASCWLQRSGCASDFGEAPIPVPFDQLAVLPLENLSGDAEQEYNFADGMTEALTTELGRSALLR